MKAEEEKNSEMKRAVKCISVMQHWYKDKKPVCVYVFLGGNKYTCKHCVDEIPRLCNAQVHKQIPLVPVPRRVKLRTTSAGYPSCHS